MVIVPTILVSTQEEWQERVQRIRGFSDRVQIDVIDGKFAANKTVDFSQMTGVEGLKLDLQLMVEEPIDWVEKCRKLGASLVIGHVEKMADQKQFVELVKMGNMRVGLGLDLDTDLSALDSRMVGRIDHVLLMSVKAGFSGQLFQEKVLPKIEAARQMVGSQIEISVDGGINATNVSRIARVGADVAYVGSALWEAQNLQERFEELKAAV
jgi:ribulose-phosphate 3-epimerase